MKSSKQEIYIPEVSGEEIVPDPSLIVKDTSEIYKQLILLTKDYSAQRVKKQTECFSKWQQ